MHFSSEKITKIGTIPIKVKTPEGLNSFLYIIVIASPSLIHYRLKTRVREPNGFKAKECLFFKERLVSNWSKIGAWSAQAPER